MKTQMYMWPQGQGNADFRHFLHESSSCHQLTLHSAVLALSSSFIIKILNSSSSHSIYALVPAKPGLLSSMCVFLGPSITNMRNLTLLKTQDASITCRSCPAQPIN